SLGSGGGLLQKLNRDTQKVVFKASAAQIDGVLTDVYKDPVTDKGKLSKKGKLKLVCEDGIFRTVTRDAPGHNVLREVFVNGQLRIDDSLDAIRARAAV
ncbi:MAG: nicotinate phosphoribosyltransferase, partial [Oxalobacteraceae bacterium]